MSEVMYARKQLDISARDLRAVLADRQAAEDRAREEHERAIAARWSDGREVIAALSVRTGFDALLRVLALPRGARVVITGVTIPHMHDLLTRYGLTVCAIPLDPDTLQTSAQDIARELARGDVACVILTHLFGARASTEAIIDAAHEAGAWCIEDCAQAFDGAHERGFRGSRTADVSMFSFGTIKTATAFGGGLFSVRDEDVAARLRAVLDGYPVLPTSAYVKKLARYGAIMAALDPRAYGMIWRMAQALDHNLDASIRRATRGFPGPDWQQALRHRPPAMMLAMLRHRLQTYDPDIVERRARVGATLMDHIEDRLPRFGAQATRHTHWLTPVCVQNGDALIAALRRAGFDATTGSSTLVAIGELGARRDAAMMREIVYLPSPEQMTPEAIARMAQIVNRVALAPEWARHTTRTMSRAA